MHNSISKGTSTIGSTLSWRDLWENQLLAELFDDSYRPLQDYVWLARNTESPKPYHLWSLISLTAALVSNHAFMSRGIGGKLKLNMGIVLIGRASIRKSSAISFMQRFASNLSLNYGPTDTGGARHGIMTAMQTRWQDDLKEDDPNEIPDSLDALAASSFDSVIAKIGAKRTRPSSIYFAAKELGRLLTAQTRELLDFFNDGLDSEPIFYQTKTGNIRVPVPLINLIGATTPGNIPSILPRDAHDHGLLSRIIFVYAGKPERSVPIPPAMSEAEESLQASMLDSLIKAATWATGEIPLATDGEDEYRRLYEYAVPTLEFRLNPYTGRRPDHLARVAAVICILRGETPFRINRRDVGLAHLILMLTECDMDGAYMGLDRTVEGQVFSIIREVLESIDGPHDRDTLYSHMTRAGIKDEDATRAFQRLVDAKRLDIKAGRVVLGGSIGGEKAAVYVKQLMKRLNP